MAALKVWTLSLHTNSFFLLSFTTATSAFRFVPSSYMRAKYYNLMYNHKYNELMVQL